MIDINVPYFFYLSLDEKKRYEIDFQVSYSNLEVKDYFCEIPLEDRSFGFVKDLMSFYAENEVEEIMKLFFSLPEYEEKEIMQAPAWKSILTIQNLFDKIESLINIEVQMLTPAVPNDKYAAQIEQIDFSMFTNEYTQTRELAGKDITKFEEVRNLPYKNCLIELTYRQKESDLERLVMNTKK